MHKMKFRNSFKHLKNGNVLLFPIDNPVQNGSEKANLKQNFCLWYLKEIYFE